MKDDSVQTCVTAKKSAPCEWRIRPPLFTVGHFDERVSQFTALALLMGLAASTTCAAETDASAHSSHLQQQHGVAIDTRLSAYYNGWPQRANGPEGHGAAGPQPLRPLAGAMSDDQLRARASSTSSSPIPPSRCTAARRITSASRRG